MPRDLTTLFYPQSVAIIGASRSPEKLGAIVLKNIINSGYKGVIYPVNPNADVIYDLKAYKDSNDLPQIPDLYIIAIPSTLVCAEIEKISQKGGKNVVVFSAGFKEIGSEGFKMEKEIHDLAKKHGINLLGPNCLGFVNNNCPINATFGGAGKQSGNLRFITQSGAIAAGIFDWCQSSNLGFSDFVTLGNKTILHETDILDYFYQQSNSTLYTNAEDGFSHVNPIGLYLESITDGVEFLRITKVITKKDPIFILKPGKTYAAVRAMQSHTGAIAGEDDVFDAALEEAGVIRCDTLEDFFDLSRSFAWEDAPLGPRVAIISNAGGPAVISADAVIREGLELAEIDGKTREKLVEVLPRSSSIINPIDVLGDALADRYEQALEIILQTDQVDSLIIILTPQIMTQIQKTAEIIGKISKKYKKPIFCSFIGGNLVAEGEKILNQYKIPSFRFPERAVFAIGAMWQFQKQKDFQKYDSSLIEIKLPQESVKIKDIIQKAVSEEMKTLDNLQANEVLSLAGIPTPPTKLVQNVDEAINFAYEIGWPVVLKLSSPGLLHKKDVGGVILDIVNEEQLKDAWFKLGKKIEQLDDKIKTLVKFQIQKDIADGVEVLVGVKQDATFGLTLLFGAGGMYAELVGDKKIHLLPINLNEVKELVKNSKIYSLLKDENGKTQYALDKLYDVILRITKLASIMPDVSDIEINPVIVDYNDVWAVDGKVVLKEGQRKTAPQGPKFKIAVNTQHDILASKFHFYEFEPTDPFVFKSGQYISVKVSNDAIRAYSIACHEKDTKFNLLVDTRPGGQGSMYFENIKVGDKIPFLGPFGVFTLNMEDGADTLLFFATGSGASAIRCMIDDALTVYKTHKKIIFYFGLTFEEEIFWKDHFEELKSKYPNFDFKIALCKPSEKWKGHKGF
ncbi:hypothetical protein A2V49_00170, partial [candidate division WWE3 bacterium RBG_19FT_COMBO_34_6]